MKAAQKYLLVFFFFFFSQTCALFECLPKINRITILQKKKKKKKERKGEKNLNYTIHTGMYIFAFHLIYNKDKQKQAVNSLLSSYKMVSFFGGVQHTCPLG